MPRFEIVGYGRETGRKRVRIYDAETKEDAIHMASSDGTVVEYNKIRELPEPPATSRQLSYARDLGIKIPKKATKAQMIELIQAAIDDDIPSRRLLEKAERLGIDVKKVMTAVDLENLIYEVTDRSDIERWHDRLDDEVSSYRPKKWRWGLAMLLSLALPGLGQFYKRQFLNSVIWFGLTTATYGYRIEIGMVLHGFCIWSASKRPKKCDWYPY